MIHGNNQITVLLIFAICIGLVSLASSWRTVSIKEEMIAHQNAQTEKMLSSLATLEKGIEALSYAATQKNFVSGSAQQHPHIQLDSFSSRPPGLVGNNDTVLANAAPDSPTKKELERITIIVDKLRARDVSMYPNFQSLMNSLEMTNLGPAARNQLLSEVGRMFESGEIDKSFFNK